VEDGVGGECAAQPVFTAVVRCFAKITGHFALKSLSTGRK
jgi:hypothetical protein